MSQFSLLSPAFVNDADILQKFTCEGSDTSPALEWRNAPEKTQSIALSCIDPDAPMGDWIHWIAWNIPADWRSLVEGIDPKDQTDFVQGTNSWGITGYGGPCPPKGHGSHRYYFKVYCLDIPILEISSQSTWKNLENAMKGHILATAEIMGRYERK